MSEAFALNPRLDLPAAAGLLTHLLSIPPEEETLLDATEVTHLGALCVQSLLAAGQRSAKAGGSLRILNVSDRVHKQLGAMGLSLEKMMEGQS